MGEIIRSAEREIQSTKLQQLFSEINLSDLENLKSQTNQLHKIQFFLYIINCFIKQSNYPRNKGIRVLSTVYISPSREYPQSFHQYQELKNLQVFRTSNVFKEIV